MKHPQQPGGGRSQFPDIGDYYGTDDDLYYDSDNIEYFFDNAGGRSDYDVETIDNFYDLIRERINEYNEEQDEKLTDEEILKKLGVNINDKVYDLLYSSRRVIKNDDLNTQANHYYSSDVWGDVAKTFEYAVQKGYTLYGEIVGYTRDGAYIQKGYDYGCIQPIYEDEYVEDVHYRVYVYRITFTNEDGNVSELSWRQIKAYCQHFGINHVPEYYFGKLVDFDKSLKKIKSDEEFNETIIKLLEEKYLEKYCEFCGNRVPSEGIVLRVDELFNFDAYKLKSFAFMEWESKQLDDNIIDIEAEQ